MFVVILFLFTQLSFWRRRYWRYKCKKVKVQ